MVGYRAAAGRLLEGLVVCFCAIVGAGLIATKRLAYQSSRADPLREGVLAVWCRSRSGNLLRLPMVGCPMVVVRFWKR